MRNKFAVSALILFALILFNLWFILFFCDGWKQFRLKYSLISGKEVIHAKLVDSVPKAFRRRVTSEQMQNTLELIKTFTKLMDKHNITFFAFYGTLVGIVRHQGIIPWDDDIDILIDSTKKEQLKEACKEISKTHGLIYYEGKFTGRWKFYKNDGQEIVGKPFRYPYLDMFFYYSNSKDTFREELDGYVMKKTEIFPLVKRSFNGVLMNTPCASDDIMKKVYDLSVCISPSFNHSKEYPISNSERKTAKCDILYPYFPFVRKTSKNYGEKIVVTEKLVKNNKVIQTSKYFLPLKCDGKTLFYESEYKAFSRHFY